MDIVMVLSSLLSGSILSVGVLVGGYTLLARWYRQAGLLPPTPPWPQRLSGKGVQPPPASAVDRATGPADAP